MKKNTIVEIISALFILLFLYTALSKTFQINNTVNVLLKTPIFANIAKEVATGVVLMEYLITALLILPVTRKMGLYASLGLMLSFTFYIAYMMFTIPHLPCSCGGVISKMTWSQHLTFNMIFNLLALIAIVLINRKPNNSSRKIVLASENIS